MANKQADSRDKSVAIVTGFIDIDRNSWDRYPRSNDVYFDYFTRLAVLENPFYIFTEERFVERILEIRGGKETYIHTIDLRKDFKDMLERITKIQESSDYKIRLNDSLKNHPEYVIPEYTLVTNLKWHFVDLFVDKFQIKTDLISWIDFGYVRDRKTLGSLKRLVLDFDTRKIHYLVLKGIPASTNVEAAIFNNEDFVSGGAIVASPVMFKKLNNYANSSLSRLLSVNIVDDDQGILLDAYLNNSEDFELHDTDGKWFQLFKYAEHDQRFKKSALISAVLSIYLRGTNLVKKVKKMRYIS